MSSLVIASIDRRAPAALAQQRLVRSRQRGRSLAGDAARAGIAAAVAAIPPAISVAAMAAEALVSRLLRALPCFVFI